MPAISFNTADILRARVMEKGWKPLQITAIEGPTANSKKDGFNYTVVFTLIEDSDLAGKEFKRVFSNKAISMMIPLIAAARGLKESDIPKEGFTLDTDELLGKKIDGLVDTDTYEGQLKNVVEVYLPYKASSQIPAF